ncbi:PREDICTED: uncharacterized protein LOC109583431 [Amphimedon queenslandica]|nr:PREDICTED: uncharacterized protein LOC109583431 [Amphimedon queenslandica]|eukprot:XP_019854337.1 PREDICTED: uncharacterized protein LOC109583431 [Amphimedon queenslandica]
MWGGVQPDLPMIHDSEKKKSMCSVMEVCHLGTGRWEQKPTTGNPPMIGVTGYAAAAIGNVIFYFGGYCNHDSCYHNILCSFNVDTFNWKELSPSTSRHGPMMKSHCDMIAIKVSGEDYLVVIGGYGPSFLYNTPKHPGAQYSGEGLVFNRQRCNEINYYKLSTGQWILLTVTGDRPPPMDEFTLTSINNSSAILFGGDTTDGLSNNVYILNFTDTSVNCLKLSNPGGSVQWPKGRRAHSSVLITTSSGPHLLVVGGVGAYDCVIFDISNKSWKQLFNIPDIVTNRREHSLSVWSVTPTTNWIIVFGGMRDYLTISDIAVIELRYTSDNDWSTSVIPLDQYQEKLQERRREWEASQPVQPENRREIDRLRRVLQERERELQEERREKEQVRNRLQQQLQGIEQQLQQAQQQGQERERQAREREQDLQRQLKEYQERERQLKRQIEGGQQ